MHRFLVSLEKVMGHMLLRMKFRIILHIKSFGYWNVLFAKVVILDCTNVREFDISLPVLSNSKKMPRCILSYWLPTSGIVYIHDEMTQVRLISKEVLCTLSLAGFDWGKIPSLLALSWAFAGMLCGATVFSDDCETYILSWPWCYWTSWDCWMDSKYMLLLPQQKFLLSHSLFIIQSLIQSLTLKKKIVINKKFLVFLHLFA